MASPKADLKEHAEVHATCRLVPVMMQTGMTGSGFVPIDSRPATSASRASFPGFNEDAHRAQRQDRDKLRRTWVTDFEHQVKPPAWQISLGVPMMIVAERWIPLSLLYNVYPNV